MPRRPPEPRDLPMARSAPLQRHGRASRPLSPRASPNLFSRVLRTATPSATQDTRSAAHVTRQRIHDLPILRIVRHVRFYADVDAGVEAAGLPNYRSHRSYRSAENAIF